MNISSQGNAWECAWPRVPTWEGLRMDLGQKHRSMCKHGQLQPGQESPSLSASSCSPWWIWAWVLSASGFRGCNHLTENQVSCVESNSPLWDLPGEACMHLEDTGQFHLRDILVWPEEGGFFVFLLPFLLLLYNLR